MIMRSSLCPQTQVTVIRLQKELENPDFFLYLYFHKRHNLKNCVHLKARSFQKSLTNTSYSLEKTWGNTGLPVTRTIL